MATRTRLQVAAELLAQGRLAEAKARLVKELRLDPRSVPALQLLGAVLSELGAHGEAIDHLRRAVRLAPSEPGPQLNLGRALTAAWRLDEAAETLAGCVRRWPDIQEGRLSYGNVLLAKGEHRAAIEQYQAAIDLAPGNPGLYTNLALALYEAGEDEAVCEICERVLKLDPANGVAMFLLTKCRQLLCAWDGFDARRQRFTELVEQGHVARGMALTSMLISDSGALHRRCAELTARHYLAGRKLPQPPRLAVRKSGRPRIAYLSADFRQHPVASALAALVEAHAADRFETVGISFGPDDGSAARRRLERAFHRFHDLRESQSDAIVRAMREMEVDIAVDLMGYTQDCRPTIFMQRCAPIQVSYLGFPGTTGLAAMDYLIVDGFIADGEIRRTATERLAILPDCLLGSDHVRHETMPVPTRASCGLHEDAFVFCSFNDRKKLTPEVFDRWMQILRRVANALLWIRKPPDAAAAALRREAESRGVDPQRIVFAERVESHAAHIARNAVADLHLDTFPYNAHVTATDALRVGAPILTLSGATYPSRVCGSMLTTVGVPELVTTSADEYVALAVRLAGDKAMLADLRRRIDHGRASSPLFDPVRLCRNLERAYEAMLERSRAGKPPAEIDLRTAAAPA